MDIDYPVNGKNGFVNSAIYDKKDYCWLYKCYCYKQFHTYSDIDTSVLLDFEVTVNSITTINGCIHLR